MVGSPIVLVNRVGEPLNFVADGQHHVLQPGDNHGFVDSQAYFAMAQNPLMGSEDFYTLNFQSLVGVKGKTPCEPFSDDELLASYETIERFNREESGLRPGIRVKGQNRPRGRSVASSANLGTLAVGESA